VGPTIIVDRSIESIFAIDQLARLARLARKSDDSTLGLCLAPRRVPITQGGALSAGLASSSIRPRFNGAIQSKTRRVRPPRYTSLTRRCKTRRLASAPRRSHLESYRARAAARLISIMRVDYERAPHPPSASPPGLLAPSSTEIPFRLGEQRLLLGR
jgi:hypothetical protein